MNTYHFYHPWHSLSVGPQAPAIVSSVIEITQGSKAKYELDKQTGFLRLDRILASHLSYPFHYGFVPQTLYYDQDPLDILIICQEKLVPLSIVEARVVGAIKMVDENQQDDKIIAVANTDPWMSSIKDLSDLPVELLDTIKFFFESYKIPEGKKVVIEGFAMQSQALSMVTQSIALYKQQF